MKIFLSDVSAYKKEHPNATLVDFLAQYETLKSLNNYANKFATVKQIAKMHGDDAEKTSKNYPKSPQYITPSKGKKLIGCSTLLDYIERLKKSA